MRIHEMPQALIASNTVYIVGTGPSLRCFDLAFFRDKVTIGLNQAWKHFNPTYSITVHPELYQEYKAAKDAEVLVPPKVTKDVSLWFVKKKPPMADLELDDPSVYVFNTSYELDTVAKRPNDTLYLGEGVQTCAMDLAGRWGARFIVLVGCDGGSLDGDFHAHDQHVKWLGMKADDQYALYRQSTAEVREVLRGKGVSVMSMTPFIGVNGANEDYARLKAELKLPVLPTPQDKSGYKRDPKTIRVKKGAKP